MSHNTKHKVHHENQHLVQLQVTKCYTEIKAFYIYELIE